MAGTASLLVQLNGILYRVSVVPAEQPASRGCTQSVVFETADRRWVGSVPTELLLDPLDLDEAELRILLRHALRNG